MKMANSEATIARSRAIPIQKAKQKQGFLYELKTNKFQNCVYDKTEI